MADKQEMNREQMGKQEFQPGRTGELLDQIVDYEKSRQQMEDGTKGTYNPYRVPNEKEYFRNYLLMADSTKIQREEYLGIFQEAVVTGGKKQEGEVPLYDDNEVAKRTEVIGESLTHIRELSLEGKNPQEEVARSQNVFRIEEAMLAVANANDGEEKIAAEDKLRQLVGVINYGKNNGPQQALEHMTMYVAKMARGDRAGAMQELDEWTKEKVKRESAASADSQQTMSEAGDEGAVKQNSSGQQENGDGKDAGEGDKNKEKADGDEAGKLSDEEFNKKIDEQIAYMRGVGAEQYGLDASGKVVDIQKLNKREYYWRSQLGSGDENRRLEAQIALSAILDVNLADREDRVINPVEGDEVYFTVKALMQNIPKNPEDYGVRLDSSGQVELVDEAKFIERSQELSREFWALEEVQIEGRERVLNRMTAFSLLSRELAERASSNNTGQEDETSEDEADPSNEAKFGGDKGRVHQLLERKAKLTFIKKGIDAGQIDLDESDIAELESESGLIDMAMEAYQNRKTVTVDESKVMVDDIKGKAVELSTQDADKAKFLVEEIKKENAESELTSVKAKELAIDYQGLSDRDILINKFVGGERFNLLVSEFSQRFLKHDRESIRSAMEMAAFRLTKEAGIPDDEVGEYLEVLSKELTNGVLQQQWMLRAKADGLTVPSFDVNMTADQATQERQQILKDLKENETANPDLLAYRDYAFQEWFRNQPDQKKREFSNKILGEVVKTELEGRNIADEKEKERIGILIRERRFDPEVLDAQFAAVLNELNVDGNSDKVLERTKQKLSQIADVLDVMGMSEREAEMAEAAQMMEEQQKAAMGNKESQRKFNEWMKAKGWKYVGVGAGIAVGGSLLIGAHIFNNAFWRPMMQGIKDGIRA